MAERQYVLRYRVPKVYHDNAMFPAALHAAEFDRFCRVTDNESRRASVTFWCDLPNPNDQPLDATYVYHAEWVR